MFKAGRAESRLLTAITFSRVVRPVMVSGECRPGIDVVHARHVALNEGTRSTRDITGLATATVGLGLVVVPIMRQVRVGLAIHAVSIKVLLVQMRSMVSFRAAHRTA